MTGAPYRAGRSQLPLCNNRLLHPAPPAHLLQVLFACWPRPMLEHCPSQVSSHNRCPRCSTLHATPTAKPLACPSLHKAPLSAAAVTRQLQAGPGSMPRYSLAMKITAASPHHPAAPRHTRVTPGASPADARHPHAPQCLVHLAVGVLEVRDHQLEAVRPAAPQLAQPTMRCSRHALRLLLQEQPCACPCACPCTCTCSARWRCPHVAAAMPHTIHHHGTAMEVLKPQPAAASHHCCCRGRG